MTSKKQYRLFTAITMIIGVCIGSGIFFKSDNILVATNGSILLGVLVFILGAFSIIFGGLAIGQLAAKTSKPGGIITYAEEFVSSKMACGIGWFLIFIYYPALIAVVSHVIGIYVCLLFHFPKNLLLEICIGGAFLLLCFGYNVLTVKFGSLFQNVSTMIKLIPLFAFAVIGICFGDPSAAIAAEPQAAISDLTWISAIAPIAFSYDGWIVSTSIAHEIKDSQKNLPRALTIAPIFILLAYVLYFVGISCYLGPQTIIEAGDSHIYLAAQKLLGEKGASILLTFIIISVMGTVNGLVLGYIRIPYSLSLRPGMIPWSSFLSKENEKTQIPTGSAFFCIILVLFWYATHYFVEQFQLLSNSDVSEIAISIGYVFYMILYYQVYRLYRLHKIKGWVKGVLIPLLAIVGSMMILSGCLHNPLFLIYAAFCIAVVLLGFYYYDKKLHTS